MESSCTQRETDGTSRGRLGCEHTGRADLLFRYEIEARAARCEGFETCAPLARPDEASWVRGVTLYPWR